MCTFLSTRGKFFKTHAFEQHAFWSIHWVFILIFIFSNFQLTPKGRHKPRKRAHLVGPSLHFGPSQIAKGPIPIPKVVRKETHPFSVLEGSKGSEPAGHPVLSGPSTKFAGQSYAAYLRPLPENERHEGLQPKNWIARQFKHSTRAHTVHKRSTGSPALHGAANLPQVFHDIANFLINVADIRNLAPSRGHHFPDLSAPSRHFRNSRWMKRHTTSAPKKKASTLVHGIRLPGHGREFLLHGNRLSAEGRIFWSTGSDYLSQITNAGVTSSPIKFRRS